ncbi:hypothetical protein [Scytonema sp. PRP1]|uniref:hypothetical protein n=1 Tax=Scytonema sp. PRP1 TaxID=3120513 RepID=UPI00300CB49F
MDYRSLSDDELRDEHERLVREKIRLKDELWKLGVDQQKLDIVKEKILQLNTTERNIEVSDSILRSRQI